MSLKIMSVLMDAVESVSVSNKSSADILKMAEPESSRKSSCELNDAFGLILQGVLAFTAFCILICKF